MGNEDKQLLGPHSISMLPDHMKPKKESDRITIEVNEQQLRLIKRGLEAIARAGTKQYDYALEQLDQDLFTRVGGTKQMWAIRDIIRAVERCELSSNSSLGIGNASDDARAAYDMYQVIDQEVFRGKNGIMQYSKEPLIKIIKGDR